ncbi:hypothetical protein MANY_38110 [Mycolicibacterium anyangense]|uniref:Uncharacterized protein n=1 Tax=Mycolicibacterium anyangense TaxID=1431246 RepID=A0A6N4WEE0_9MYCO|nr:hypothetical protein MANY_38110 [Mycolicibacterium anyangense]
MSATAVVVFYGLWAFERDGHSGSWFAVSMIPITIAVLRYAVDVDGGMAGDQKKLFSVTAYCNYWASRGSRY